MLKKLAVLSVNDLLWFTKEFSCSRGGDSFLIGVKDWIVSLGCGSPIFDGWGDDSRWVDGTGSRAVEFGRKDSDVDVVPALILRHSCYERCRTRPQSFEREFPGLTLTKSETPSTSKTTLISFEKGTSCFRRCLYYVFGYSSRYKVILK